MLTGAGALVVLGCAPSAGAVYTLLSGDCVTRVSTHGPYGNVLQTLSNTAVVDCETACDADVTCSGFSYTPGATNVLGACTLKGDQPYAGWCDTGIPGRAGSPPCTTATCFHAKSLLPEGYYIEHMVSPPYGHDKCQQKCAANARGGRLMDVIATEAEYNALTAVLGADLDTVIGYRQASGAVEPGGNWSWESQCTGFQPPFHTGVTDPGEGHEEPNNWAPRLEVSENCATMWNGRISDVTCEWDTEMHWLPTECLCQDSLPCTTTTTTTVDPNAVPPVTVAAVPTAAPATPPPPAPPAPTTASPEVGRSWVPIVIAAGIGLLLVGAMICCCFAQKPAKKKQTRVAKKDVRTVVPDAELAPLAPSLQLPMVPLMAMPTAPMPMTFMAQAPTPMQFVTMQGMQPVTPQPSLSLPLAQAAHRGYTMVPVNSPVPSGFFP